MDINTINLFFSATILLALIWFAWWLRGKFDKIDNNFAVFKHALLSLMNVSLNMLKLFEKIDEIRKDKESNRQVIKNISTLENVHDTVINITSFNPLTKSEVERLVIYVKVCQEGKRLLEYEEAKDFDQIAQKIKKERSDDVGAILIAGVAGLALGVYPTASE